MSALFPIKLLVVGSAFMGSAFMGSAFSNNSININIYLGAATYIRKGSLLLLVPDAKFDEARREADRLREEKKIADYMYAKLKTAEDPVCLNLFVIYFEGESRHDLTVSNDILEQLKKSPYVLKIYQGSFEQEHTDRSLFVIDCKAEDVGELEKQIQKSSKLQCLELFPNAMNDDANIVVQALQRARELSGKDKEDLIHLNKNGLPLSKADLVFVSLPDGNKDYLRQGIITNGQILLYNGEELKFNGKDLQFSYRGVTKKYEDIRSLLKDEFKVSDIESVMKIIMEPIFVRSYLRKKEVLLGNQYGIIDIPLVQSFDIKKLSTFVPGTLVDIQLSDDQKICEIIEKKSASNDVNRKVLHSIGVLLYDSAEKEVLLGKADSPSFVDFILNFSSVIEKGADEDILYDEDIYRYMRSDELESLKSHVLKAYSYKLDRSCLINMLNDKNLEINVEPEYKNEIQRWKTKNNANQKHRNNKNANQKHSNNKNANQKHSNNNEDRLSFDTLYKVQEYIEQKYLEKFNKLKEAKLSEIKKKNLLKLINGKASKISKEIREDPLEMNFENWSAIKGAANLRVKHLNVDSELRTKQADILEPILNSLNREAFLKKAVDLLKERIIYSINHDHYVEWLKILPETRKYWKANVDNKQTLRRIIERLYLVDVKDVKQDLNSQLKKKTFEYKQGLQWIKLDDIKNKVLQDDADSLLKTIQKLSPDKTSEVSDVNTESASTIRGNEILFE